MSQQSVRLAARRSALDAQAVLRKERADRERRLEALAVAVLTALGERDALVRDAERRAGQALRTMTDNEGLSVREAVDWCGSGLTVREITRLLRLDDAHQGQSKRTSRMSGSWANYDQVRTNSAHLNGQLWTPAITGSRAIALEADLGGKGSRVQISPARLSKWPNGNFSPGLTWFHDRFQL